MHMHAMEPSPKCQVLPVDPDGIPESLKGEIFITWKAGQKPDGRLNKLPAGAANGLLCDGTDPANGGPFEQALGTYRAKKLGGIGIPLHADSRLSGADLDNSVRFDGTLEPWAQEIVDDLNSYTEYSPSGTGIRIFVYGSLPVDGTKVGNVELYSSGRFLTVTGRHVPGTPPDVMERDEELRDLYMRLRSQGRQQDAARPGEEPETDTLMAFDQNEPPIRLHPYHLRIWNGEVPHVKPTGEIDHSETIWDIGWMLARNGCTRWCIAACLANRDVQLGYHKYSGRRDDREYRRIAAKTWHWASQQCRISGASQEERSLTAELAEARAERDRAIRERDEERRQESLKWAALRGQGVADSTKRIPAAERITEVVTVFAYKASVSAGKTDAEGFAPVRLGQLGDSAGCSPDTVSRHLKKAEERGLIEVRRTPNEESGHTDLAIRLKEHPDDTLRMIAGQERTEAWGGASDRGKMKVCPDHPRARLIRRWTTACEDCGQIVDRGEQTLEGDDEPETTPDPQLAAPWNVVVATPPTRKMRVAPVPRSLLVFDEPETTPDPQLAAPEHDSLPFGERCWEAS